MSIRLAQKTAIILPSSGTLRVAIATSSSGYSINNSLINTGMNCITIMADLHILVDPTGC